LPGALDAALHTFDASTAATGLLGKDVVSHYATAAKSYAMWPRPGLPMSNATAGFSMHEKASFYHVGGS
jgi:hypothetical protein